MPCCRQPIVEVTQPVQVVVRPFDRTSDEDVRWAAALIDRLLGGRIQAVRGTTFDVLALPGFVAELGEAPAGIATYRPVGSAFELAVLAAATPRSGIGRALVAAVRAVAAERPLRVVTTNDNLDALRFYQRQGFRLVELRAGAVDEARRTIKPGIPLLGAHGIALRDELELELSPPD